MAARLEQLAREWQGRYPQIASGLSNLAKTARELGAPESFSDVDTVEKPAIKTFSKDQLIIPETKIPQEVADILSKAEKAGFNTFEPYHLSGVTLTRDTSVEGWNKKPENWYWEQIGNGKISQNAPKLPGYWVLIDKTARPNYKDGKQLHENDPLGILLARLREERKIEIPNGLRHVPQTSRFAISPNELRQVVLPEIAKLLGVEVSKVKLPKEIEFNVIGNMKHPEWGTANTAEWLEDDFGDGLRLFGGHSGFGGLAGVNCDVSGFHDGDVAFRPLVVLTPKV